MHGAEANDRNSFHIPTIVPPTSVFHTMLFLQQDGPSWFPVLVITLLPKYCYAKPDIRSVIESRQGSSHDKEELNASSPQFWDNILNTLVDIESLELPPTQFYNLLDGWDHSGQNFRSESCSQIQGSLPKGFLQGDEMNNKLGKNSNLNQPGIYSGQNENISKFEPVHSPETHTEGKVNADLHMDAMRYPELVRPVQEQEESDGISSVSKVDDGAHPPNTGFTDDIGRSTLSPPQEINQVAMLITQPHKVSRPGEKGLGLMEDKNSKEMGYEMIPVGMHTEDRANWEKFERNLCGLHRTNNKVKTPNSDCDPETTQASGEKGKIAVDFEPISIHFNPLMSNDDKILNNMHADVVNTIKLRQNLIPVKAMDQTLKKPIQNSRINSKRQKLTHQALTLDQGLFAPQGGNKFRSMFRDLRSIGSKLVHRMIEADGTDLYGLFRSTISSILLDRKVVGQESSLERKQRDMLLTGLQRMERTMIDGYVGGIAFIHQYGGEILPYKKESSMEIAAQNGWNSLSERYRSWNKENTISIKSLFGSYSVKELPRGGQWENFEKTLRYYVASNFAYTHTTAEDHAWYLVKQWYIDVLPEGWRKTTFFDMTEVYFRNKLLKCYDNIPKLL